MVLCYDSHGKQYREQGCVRGGGRGAVDRGRGGRAADSVSKHLLPVTSRRFSQWRAGRVGRLL